MAREQALDPRLLEIIRVRRFSTGHMIGPPSTQVLERPVMEYLAGRLDYGALYLEIIQGLLRFSDRLFEDQLSVMKAARAPMIHLAKDGKLGESIR